MFLDNTDIMQKAIDYIEFARVFVHSPILFGQQRCVCGREKPKLRVKCKSCRPKHPHGESKNWCVNCQTGIKAKNRQCVCPECREDLYITQQHDISIEFAIKYARTATCDICNRLVSGKSLHIDHCHSTGFVRGILCSHCNSGLGRFRDSVISMRSAINYVKVHKNRLL